MVNTPVNHEPQLAVGSASPVFRFRRPGRRFRVHMSVEWRAREEGDDAYESCLGDIEVGMPLAHVPQRFIE